MAFDRRLLGLSHRTFGGGAHSDDSGRSGGWERTGGAQFDTAKTSFIHLTRYKAAGRDITGTAPIQKGRRFFRQTKSKLLEVNIHVLGTEISFLGKQIFTKWAREQSKSTPNRGRLPPQG
jgi:hypothetical protein